MKSTGIVRKIDELGRIVLPIEMRLTLDIAERDPLEIFVEDSQIILKKYVTGEAESVPQEKCICSICQREIDDKAAVNRVRTHPPMRIHARVKHSKG
ncbi:MAG: AbrB/MazE/SpoVT family DNA-binding domain-containing protein [Clostridiales bacterium]|nr:AbrB/MazE/SpoVT family DNA-binding domain-containing protein [Clostridiales bacterium]